MIKTLSVLLVVTFISASLVFVSVAHAADAAASMTPSEMHTLEAKNVDVKGNLDKDVKDKDVKGDVKGDAKDAKHEKDCDCKECAGKKGKKSCKTCKHCKMGHHTHDDKGTDAKASDAKTTDVKASDAAPAKKE